jgi:transposase
LPSCAAKSFHNKVELAQELQPSLGPLLITIEHLTEQIHLYDGCLQDRLQAYPEAELVQQVPGVGPITALAFVLLLQDPRRFDNSRDVGAYVGLVSRQRQSGDVDPQLRITKAGNPLVRRLLVQAAHYTLGPFGPDSDLRRFGLRLIERGGKAAKKRAIVAVARKLAVLLHRLWMTAEVYQPIGYSRFEQAA